MMAAIFTGIGKLLIMLMLDDSNIIIGNDTNTLPVVRQRAAAAHATCAASIVTFLWGYSSPQETEILCLLGIRYCICLERWEST